MTEVQEKEAAAPSDAMKDVVNESQGEEGQELAVKINFLKESRVFKRRADSTVCELKQEIEKAFRVPIVSNAGLQSLCSHLAACHVIAAACGMHAAWHACSGKRCPLL